MITATATLQSVIEVTAQIVGKQVGNCDDATVTNQAGDYSLSIASGDTDKLQFGKVKDSDGTDVQVDYIPAADGYMFEATPQVTDLIITIKVASGDDTISTITIDANAAGTIDTVDDGGLSNLVIEVNSFAVSVPFTLNNGDDLDITFDAAASDTEIQLLGTY